MSRAWWRRASSVRLPATLRSIRRLTLLLFALVLAPASRVEAELALPVSDAARLAAAADAIDALEVDAAAKLLGAIRNEGPAVRFERARLALYRGDCSAARTILSSPAFAGKNEAARLYELAEACAGALSDAREIEDRERGIAVRLQDDRDEALVPFIVDVAARSRDAMRRQLGVQLPRPLRVDLVRDNFSLSAVTGLPLQAAETTGTVAVARWGRVVMMSPRAAPHGYPWQDTLAHEIVHLALTQATGDHAPLWLQEGLAKINETAWREARPFDGQPDADDVAARALSEGHSVGIDSIGPSIAMLPSPEQASIAYAEVESFVRFWTETNGKAALELLLRDLRGLGTDALDRAMVSVTGYGLDTWMRRWQEELRRRGALPPDSAASRKRSRGQRGAVALLRLGDLLAEGRHFAPAALEFEKADSEHPAHPGIRWKLARSLALTQQQDLARERLGSLTDLAGPHAGWLAMRGILTPDYEGRTNDFEWAVGLHPYLAEAACRSLPGMEPMNLRIDPDSGAAPPTGAEESAGHSFLSTNEEEWHPAANSGPASGGPPPDAWEALCHEAGYVSGD